MIGVPTIREKACAYYRDQSIRLLHASTPEGADCPTAVEATVRGHESTYRVELDAGVWSCSCSFARSDCAHRAAVQMVTGHKSSASKPAKKGKV